MVLQKAVDNLKNRPKDERKAVAGGIAVLIVAILLVGWIVHFFKKIQSGGVQIEQIGSGLKGQFDISPITEAQKQLVESYKDTTDELKAIRDQAAQQQARNGQ
ncbi:MAG: hypothetical protein AAB830_00620 [Patescibacteria group bacterium]